MLGQLATTPAIFEPYRNPTTDEETESCLLKLRDVRLEQRREARRANRNLNPSDLARLWILTPTASEALLQRFGARLDIATWGEGVYLMPAGFASGFVVLHQLPRNPATLWLRLLGKGRVQQQAIDELERLSPENPLRTRAFELLSNLRVTLEARQDIEPEEQELIMRLSQVYQERLSQATEQGIQQGLEQGIQQGLEQGIQQGLERGAQQAMRQTIENFLRARFGELDAELAAAADRLVTLPNEEVTVMLLQLSREELLDRVRDAGA